MTISEEVFEYVEIDNSIIKRQWWASEQHDSCRSNPLLDFPTECDWIWYDSSWMIDCSGNCDADKGWESCMNLVGSRRTYFDSARNFDPTHRFRRRRWFRRRSSRNSDESDKHQGIDGDTSNEESSSFLFHQPIIDAYSRAAKEAERNAIGLKLGNSLKSNEKTKKTSGLLDAATMLTDDGSLKIYLKCGDGQWSSPALIPPSGNSHGVLKVQASRWPNVTKSIGETASFQKNAIDNHVLSETTIADKAINIIYTDGSLSPTCHELIYQISGLDGVWGQYTRLLTFGSRFFIKNDSQKISIEVKQIGSPDETAIIIYPGDTAPFHWADIRLPELVCVRPVTAEKSEDDDGSIHEEIRNIKYKWSGGLDVSRLGMTPLRIRTNKEEKNRPFQLSGNNSEIRSIRSLVEVSH